MLTVRLSVLFLALVFLGSLAPRVSLGSSNVPTCGVVSRALSGTFSMRTMPDQQVIEVVPEDGATLNSLLAASRRMAFVCIDAPVKNRELSLKSVAFFNMSSDKELCGHILNARQQATGQVSFFELSAMGGQTFIELSAEDLASRALLQQAVATGQMACVIGSFDGDTLPVGVASPAFVRLLEH
jgi:hypothetical protein